MSYYGGEVSEAYTYKTQTVQNGGFCLEKYVRDRVFIRWNINIPARIEFVLGDKNGVELYRRLRPVSRSYMVTTTMELQKYLGDYVPIEVTIIHYLDGRDSDMCLYVRLLSE